MEKVIVYDERIACLPDITSFKEKLVELMGKFRDLIIKIVKDETRTVVSEIKTCEISCTPEQMVEKVVKRCLELYIILKGFFRLIVEAEPAELV